MNEQTNEQEKIVEENGRKYLINHYGKFALCKKCGYILGAHNCKKTKGIYKYRLK